MNNQTPIIDPTLLKRVHFGKSECSNCGETELVFVGIMQAAGTMPTTNCEVYQCLHCHFNMVFALTEDSEDSI